MTINIMAAVYQADFPGDIKPIVRRHAGPQTRMARSCDPGQAYVNITGLEVSQRYQGVWLDPSGFVHIVDLPRLDVAATTIPGDGAEHVIMEFLPAGTRVAVQGRGAVEMEADDNLVFASDTPGDVIQFEILPPRPWADMQFSVVVT